MQQVALQLHRLGAEDARIHLGHGLDERAEAHLRDHVAFGVEARRDLAQGDAVGGQLEHRAFGDIEHRPAQPRGARARKGDLLDRRHELARPPLGTDAQRDWLVKTRAGTAISAFALTEPGSGSDVANSTMSAEKVPGGWRLNGEKTYISNGGIADLYVIFARTGEAPGARGLSAFLMPATVEGFEILERIEVVAPHPLAHFRLNDVFLPDSALIGTAGAGFKQAMAVLDVFRSTVGAAALGFARRALDEALARVQERQLFGAPLADLQMVQGHIADMALGVDASALLIYRAAWTRDMGAPRITREAAMAKLHATETAQKVIDTAVQLFGGDGVRKGFIVESLYREIRALRIYEGASDVQKVVIARQVMG